MGPRHRNLYDLERWRRNRLLLLGVGGVFIAVTILGTTVGRGAQVGTLYSLVGSLCLSLAMAFWIRQRGSYLAVEGESLVVRVVALRHRLPLEHVRRVRVAPLGSAYSTPARQAVLPRRFRRPVWLERPALVVRVSDAEDLVRLARVVGRRCVVERDLIVPVLDPQGLLEEIEAASPVPAPSAAPSRRRRRR